MPWQGRYALTRIGTAEIGGGSASRAQEQAKIGGECCDSIDRRRQRISRADEIFRSADPAPAPAPAPHSRRRRCRIPSHSRPTLPVDIYCRPRRAVESSNRPCAPEVPILVATSLLQRLAYQPTTVICAVTILPSWTLIGGEYRLPFSLHFRRYRYTAGQHFVLGWRAGPRSGRK